MKGKDGLHSRQEEKRELFLGRTQCQGKKEKDGLQTFFCNVYYSVVIIVVGTRLKEDICGRLDQLYACATR